MKFKSMVKTGLEVCGMSGEILDFILDIVRNAQCLGYIFVSH